MTEVSVGVETELMKVYAPPRVIVPPSGLVTVTLAVPAAQAGLVAWIVSGVCTMTAVAGPQPMVTVAPARNCGPVIVTRVPPVTGPKFGAISWMIGVDEARKVKPRWR